MTRRIPYAIPSIGLILLSLLALTAASAITRATDDTGRSPIMELTSSAFDPGCPPAEPVPAWVINGRGEPEPESQAIDLEAVRRRQVEEDRIFKEWLKRQRRS